MMRLSVWHPSLISWLEKYIPVDSYFLERPEVGTIAALVPPLYDLEYSQDTPYQTTGEGTQDIYIRYRFSDSRYQALPINTFEGVYQSFSLALTSNWQDIADLNSLKTVPVDDSISLEEITADGEWLVTLHWRFEATWYAEPETDWTVLEPQPVNSIVSAIWRNGLDKPLAEDPRLDIQLEIDF